MPVFEKWFRERAFMIHWIISGRVALGYHGLYTGYEVITTCFGSVVGAAAITLFATCLLLDIQISFWFCHQTSRPSFMCLWGRHTRNILMGLNGTDEPGNAGNHPPSRVKSPRRAMLRVGRFLDVVLFRRSRPVGSRRYAFIGTTFATALVG
ncbi:hypothetical protein B0J17DRAFT_707450 [Rhizoctonia solani]|nr:hypothetical protein B0J17DRAFT_707450 [Rhizoctonia solani]